MLVLSRLKGESVMIGDDLPLTVMEIEAERVRMHASGKAAGGRISLGAVEAWLEQDQEMSLGTDVSCCLVGIVAGKVRVGINVPRNVSVHRKEVYDATSAGAVRGRPTKGRIEGKRTVRFDRRPVRAAPLELTLCPHPLITSRLEIGWRRIIPFPTETNL
jgi:sRNA-binding carbon storage regulator CsrA